jgi:hypothetical protein
MGRTDQSVTAPIAACFRVYWDLSPFWHKGFDQHCDDAAGHDGGPHIVVPAEAESSVA